MPVTSGPNDACLRHSPPFVMIRGRINEAASSPDRQSAGLDALPSYGGAEGTVHADQNLTLEMTAK